MFKGMYRNFVIAGLIVVLAFGVMILSGCVVNRSSTRYLPQDPAIGKAGLKSVKIGKTTKDEIVGVFGAPSAQSISTDGIETLKYNYGKKTEGDFCAFLFVVLRNDKEERMTIYFEIKNGVVAKYWKEP
jgi:outer membrane protein assembly factor BamE (lipoprotein component of BamABCDE complex)